MYTLCNYSMIPTYLNRNRRRPNGSQPTLFTCQWYSRGWLFEIIEIAQRMVSTQIEHRDSNQAGPKPTLTSTWMGFFGLTKPEIGPIGMFRCVGKPVLSTYCRYVEYLLYLGPLYSGTQRQGDKLTMHTSTHVATNERGLEIEQKWNIIKIESLVPAVDYRDLVLHLPTWRLINFDCAVRAVQPRDVCMQHPGCLWADEHAAVRGVLMTGKVPAPDIAPGKSINASQYMCSLLGWRLGSMHCAQTRSVRFTTSQNAEDVLTQRQ
ncbi:hypothetical protein FN846DRAFT_339171 [Sphaerosporella brunnea]|uniref:Uncharacterized protein n=1 Tax=Sphaerosporella brunnea TaxID=1250544 RepID=A0A5J5EJP5_9PEZI|nr:hypothetical protein FN846DRAFT_339171 [Sphaerosporella brunnea]